MFKEVLKNRLAELNISSYKLANQLNIEPQQVNAWLKGITSPSFDYLIPICTLLKLNINTLEAIDNIEYPPVNFSEVIRSYRQTNKLTQQQLGELCNKTRQTISKWEKNESIININDFYLLCHNINITPSRLLYNIDLESETKEDDQNINEEEIETKVETKVVPL